MTHRRTFLRTLAAGSASFILPAALHAKVSKLRKTVSIGLIADPHIGFINDAPSRLDAFLKQMDWDRPDAIIQLGDFATPNDKQQPHIDKFNKAHKHALHVIGNHDLDYKKTKQDCLKSWGMPAPYYSQEIEGIKVIVLDGNDKGSPTHHTHGGYVSYIGPEQQEWLKKELKSTNLPVLIISHQPLAGPEAIDNHEEIRAILLEHKDKILLSINGHSHLDFHKEIDGIHYVHINSASYYWLGGKLRYSKYKDALFTTLHIDPRKGTVTIDTKPSTWEKDIKDLKSVLMPRKHDLLELISPSISAKTFDDIDAL
jgi:3',5'-cyclic AMP phosphodiesterase CpdA